MAGFALFVIFIPVWPYQPHCGVYSSADFGTLDGEMTPDYLAAIDRAMWNEGVYHWRIGDRIYLRLLVALAPDGDLDLHGSLMDAQVQAVAGLVSPPVNVDSLAGTELLGRIYQPPAYLRALYGHNPFLVFGRDCTFIRAVAFGERPPPGYAPEPSPFDRSAE